jgi:hypothetical protein
VHGTLVKKIKGGVVVDLMGVDAFLPGSQIALRRVPNVDELLGEKYEFKIIKLNKRRRNIVVSRRVILEQERPASTARLPCSAPACSCRPITRTCWRSIGEPVTCSGMSRWRIIARTTARPARCSPSTTL